MGPLKSHKGVGTLKHVLFKFFSLKAGGDPPPPKYISAKASPGGVPRQLNHDPPRNK